MNPSGIMLARKVEYRSWCAASPSDRRKLLAVPRNMLLRNICTQQKTYTNVNSGDLIWAPKGLSATSR